MRIVMVTNNALEDKLGGLERYVRELAGTLAGRGHDVTLVAKRRDGVAAAREWCADGVVIERHPVPAKANPLYALLYPAYVAAGVHRRTRAPRAVVHAHMSVPALPLALGRASFLLTFHAPVWRELLSERQGTYALPAAVQRPVVRALRATERLVARRARAVAVLSEFMRTQLAELDPAVAARAHVIAGGLDPLRFHASAAGAAPRTPPVLFTARRLTPRTGVDALIAAMPRIVDAVPGTTLQIAGSGEMHGQLRALVQRLGLTERVTFLGRVSDAQLVDHYRSSTLVVLPTRELEGFGLTTAEALACGAAVVGTPAGATPELLAPLDPVLVAADTSHGAIAAAVVRVLSDPARLQAIRANAAARVLPDMAWSRVADRYCELYERLA